jgi:hypothetical protein
MISVDQCPDETKRSSRGCPWIAECVVDGVTYAARSRSGAPYALARVLADAGIPDAPMVVVSQGLKGETRYRSFHEMAGWTIEESATVPVRRGRWVDPAVTTARLRGTFRSKQGVRAPAEGVVAATASGA